MSTCLFMWIFICLFIRLFLSVCMSLCSSVCLSVCLVTVWNISEYHCFILLYKMMSKITKFPQQMSRKIDIGLRRLGEKRIIPFVQRTTIIWNSLTQQIMIVQNIKLKLWIKQNVSIKSDNHTDRHTHIHQWFWKYLLHLQIFLDKRVHITEWD